VGIVGTTIVPLNERPLAGGAVRDVQSRAESTAFPGGSSFKAILAPLIGLTLLTAGCGGGHEQPAADAALESSSIHRGRPAGPGSDPDGGGAVRRNTDCQRCPAGDSRAPLTR
jgi:hypothetical protein